MKYIIDEKEYDVVIDKKANKNSYIRIKEDMTIYVTTSYFSTEKSIKKMLDRNYSALQKMVTKREKTNNKKEQFFYLGRPYDIIEMNVIEGVELDETKIYVQNMDKLKKWYQAETKRIFEERYNYICSLFDENMRVPTLKIRKMKSRWGVYNRENHNVTLNSHLIEYDIDKIDYVIIHELCHIVHFNHSKEFWTLVECYCPNYKYMRKCLKE